jgi:dihydrodipicolinate synthase/N-acetylneuraminate lyase
VVLTAQDLRGVMGMMPAFTTADGGDVDATNTIDVNNLKAGVDRMIGDGIDVIATTGSFGEFHTLLPEEFETLVRATVEVVNKRVPLFVGCTSLNSRGALRKMQLAAEVGADGVLVGVPFYFPSTVDNAVEFYRQIAERFPKLAIMIYHNPLLHNVTLPVEAFARLVQSPNVVAMKDSHRTPEEFGSLMRISKGQISVFVFQTQYPKYAALGAAGCWSIDAWRGPWPLLAMRDAVQRGDEAAAQQVVADLGDGMAQPPDLSWRETASKLTIGYAGYCNPGPLRPPFVIVPEEVDKRCRETAARWQTLCEKYRPLVRARVPA